MDFARKTRSRRHVNLTPLIDIIFLLIVFFLLTSKFVTSEIVDLNLSSVEEGVAVELTDDTAMVIDLTPEGKFRMQEREYDLALLKKKMGKMIAANKDQDIVLVSESGVTVQNVITAMDNIIAVGGRNISLASK